MWEFSLKHFMHLQYVSFSRCSVFQLIIIGLCTSSSVKRQPLYYNISTKTVYDKITKHPTHEQFLGGILSNLLKRFQLVAPVVGDE